MEIGYKENGAVEADFVASSKAKNTSITLFNSACDPSTVQSNNDIPVNLAFAPCSEVENVANNTTRTYPALVEVVAGEEYKVGKWKQFWWGKHYRTTWTTPVKVPYLNLETTPEMSNLQQVQTRLSAFIEMLS